MSSLPLSDASSVADFPNAEPRRGYYRLQYLRAIAAFTVAVWHATYHLWDTRGDKGILDMTPGVLGAFGVTLFFVISGYLMASLAPKAKPFVFLAHRIIRIYPIYWVCVLLFFVINSKLLGFGFHFDPFALALIPGGPWAYMLGVEWTLPFELSFYLVVFGVILCRWQRALTWIALAWAVVIVPAMFLQAGPHLGQFPKLPFLLLSPWILPFALGVLVYAAVKRGLLGSWTLLPGIVINAMAFLYPSAAPFLLAGGGALLVAWAVTPRGQEDERSEVHWLTSMGNWSYALYLCHNSILLWIYKTAPASMSNTVLWIGAIVLPVIVSIGLGKLDTTMYGGLKKLVDGAGPAAAVTLSAVFLVTIALMSIRVF